jgi:hypothetical protein
MLSTAASQLKFMKGSPGKQRVAEAAFGHFKGVMLSLHLADLGRTHHRVEGSAVSVARALPSLQRA